MSSSIGAKCKAGSDLFDAFFMNNTKMTLQIVLFILFTKSDFTLRLNAADVHAHCLILGEIFIRQLYQRQPLRFA